MVLPELSLNATDAMTAAEPLWRPGFVQTYTHKAVTFWSKSRLPLRRTVQMILNGARVRDTARVLGVNRNTVSTQFKKSEAARAVVEWFISTPYTSVEA